MIISVQVEGLNELRDLLLRKLPEHVRGKPLQSALAKACKPIVQSARQLAPVSTGRMRRAIYSKRSKFQTKGQESRIVAVRRGRKRNDPKGAFYWKFLEFGHWIISPKRQKWQPKTVLGVVPPRPFMRPAFEANKFQAIDIFARELKGEIEKFAARNQIRISKAIRRKVTGF